MTVTKGPALRSPETGACVVMNRSAESGPGSTSMTVEARVRRLEVQVERLTEAIEVLAHGLEGGPMAEPRNHHTEEAARRAHELLLLAKSAPPDRPQA